MRLPTLAFILFLQDCLINVAHDPSQAILDCVGQLVLDSEHNAAKEERRKADRVLAATTFQLISSFKRKLLALGVDPSLAHQSANECLLEHVSHGEGTVGFVHTHTTTAPLAQPATPKKRRTQDRGSRVLEDPPFNMRYADAKTKLDWIMQHADYPDPNEFVEKSRSRIKRNQKIAECFRGCCESSVDAFIDKHKYMTKAGKLVMNFTYSELLCVDCQQRGNSNT